MGTGMVPTLVRARAPGLEKSLHATWLAAFGLQGNRDSRALLSRLTVTFLACATQRRTTRGPTSGLLFRTSK